MHGVKDRIISLINADIIKLRTFLLAIKYKCSEIKRLVLIKYRSNLINKTNFEASKEAARLSNDLYGTVSR